MSRHSLVLVVSASLAVALGGCQGCGKGQQARAQGIDAGVVRPSPTTTADCFLAATQQTNLTDAQIYDLCRGASSMGPALCYAAADGRLRLTDDQKILLCRCASSMEPVDCFDRVDRQTFLTDGQIQELCSPTLTGVLLPNCEPLG